RAVGLGEDQLRRNGASRRAKVVGVLVGHVPGKGDVPPTFDSLLEKSDGREAVQNDGATVEPLPKDRDRVLVSRTVVDDDGQPSLPGQTELVDEQLRLRISW